MSEALKIPKRFAAWGSALKAVNENHRAILRGMAWVSFFIFFSRLMGAAKEMIIAYRYGVCAELDAYIFVQSLLNWPIAIWLGVVMNLVVPLGARLRQEATAELKRFRDELFGLALLVGLSGAAIVILFQPLLLDASWTGLPNTTSAIARQMTSVLAFLVPLGLLTGLFSAWTLSAGRHANTLLECAPALVIGGAVLVSSGGSGPLIWGAVAGFGVQTGALAFLLWKRGEVGPPRFSLQSSVWPLFWSGFGALIIGQTVMSAATVIDQLFATRLGFGAISTLSYSNRIVALVVGLGITAVHRATLPVFSKMQHGDKHKIRAVAFRWVMLVFPVGVIATIFTWILAPAIVKLLFEHGAFTARDTEAVAETIRFAALQLPFYFSGIVIVSVMISSQKYGLMAINAGLNLCVKVIGNWLLVPTLGLNGVVISTSMMYAGSFAMLLFFLWSWKPTSDDIGNKQ